MKGSAHLNVLKLNDYLLSVLFEDDDILAIDKPYGINSHTNESKTEHGELAQDGLIEIYEKNLGRRLYIIHRLDQTTTGVIIFGKSAEAAKKYAEFFFQRQVKKTYWFITAEKSTKTEFLIDQTIVHKGKNLEAKTKLCFLKKLSGFELWQAHPLTGRNHQIRIHAKAAGLSILGDDKYGGKNFPFICLHNHRIEFQNGIVIISTAPYYFEHLHLLENQILSKAIFETDRRQRLFSFPNLSDQCFRLVHTKNDTKNSGLTLDQFGKKLVLSCYDEKWSEAHQKTFSYYARWQKKPIVVRMMHNRGKDPLNKSQFLIDENGNEIATSNEPVWLAQENNINFEMRSDSGQSFGLFLDQRLQRSWVLNQAKDKTVLNLFSYTCGFSVVAAVGGAKEVTSVDTSKNVLNWGRKNFTENQKDDLNYKFLCRDSLSFLEQSIHKKTKFDLIICDPPSFSRGEKGVFKIETSLESLITQCLQCLNENGDLLFSTNFEGFFVDDIRRTILKVQKALGIQHLQINHIQPALDFELPGSKSILKSFLIKTRTEAFSEKSMIRTMVAADIDEN